MTERILVLGAQGFLGRSTVSALRRVGRSIATVGRRAETGIDIHDLTDADAVSRCLATHRPDVIVNCAVVADFGSGPFADLFAVNTALPTLLAAWCARTGAKLIQISGTLVCGSRRSRYEANTPTAPDTDYARSKLLAEKTIELSRCRSAILRFGGIFGANGPAHLGINRAITDAMAGAKPTVFASGAALRNYIHVDDAGASVANVLDQGITGTHLVAGSEVLSIADMMSSICDVYLPGETPSFVAGDEATDQIVIPSPDMPPTRRFREALLADPSASPTS